MKKLMLGLMMAFAVNVFAASQPLGDTSTTWEPEAVSIADGVVSLGVTVNTNGDFTAETKDWQPVELKQENVTVKDGKIVISIPVDSQQGFMILQSGDAKVQAEEAAPLLLMR